MKLSSATLTGVTEAPSIIEDIDFILSTNSTSYPLADKLRNINAHYYDVVTDIILYNSNWEWDDTNKTDFPIGTQNLVASQRDYPINSDMLRLLRVEVKDSAGNWQKVQQFDESEVGVALSEFYKGDGLPIYYREIGNSIELYPSASATSTTLTGGLKIYTQRTQTEFTNASATVSPGFAAPFHRLLSYGAAYDYAIIRSLPVAPVLKQRIDEMKQQLREYYSSRNREASPKMTFRALKVGYE